MPRSVGPHQKSQGCLDMVVDVYATVYVVSASPLPTLPPEGGGQVGILTALGAPDLRREIPMRYILFINEHVVALITINGFGVRYIFILCI